MKTYLIVVVLIIILVLIALWPTLVKSALTVKPPENPLRNYHVEYVGGYEADRPSADI